MTTSSVNLPARGLSAVFDRARKEPAFAAFVLLYVGYVALPLLMGIDKFAKVLNTDWPGYLAPWIVDVLPFSAQTAMYVVGVVEILAAVMVAIKPRYASFVVAAWLAGIIFNLLTYSGFYDVALRDFGLLLGALALALLARAYDSPWTRAGHRHTESAHTDSVRIDSAHTDSMRNDSAHTDSTHTKSGLNGHGDATGRLAPTDSARPRA